MNSRVVWAIKNRYKFISNCNRNQFERKRTVFQRKNQPNIYERLQFQGGANLRDGCKFWMTLDDKVSNTRYFGGFNVREKSKSDDINFDPCSNLWNCLRLVNQQRILSNLIGWNFSDTNIMRNTMELGLQNTAFIINQCGYQTSKWVCGNL